MDLINKFSQSQKHFSQTSITHNLIQSLLSNPEINISNIPSLSSLNILAKLSNIQEIDIISNIQYYQHSSSLIIASQFIKNCTIFRIQMENHRILMNRFSLMLNSLLNYINIKINPITGQTTLSNHFYGIQQPLEYSIIQTIYATFSNIRFNAANLLKNLQNFICSDKLQNCRQKQRYQDTINRIFVYVQSCNKYTWANINKTQQNSDKKNPDFFYKNLPRDFKQKIHKIKVSKFQYLKNIYSKVIQNQRIQFRLNSTREDEQLEKIINDICMRSRESNRNILLKQLLISNQLIFHHRKQKQFDINCTINEEGEVNIKFENLSKNIQGLNHQRQIIKKIRYNQNIGLCKYYYSLLPDFVNYRISNLVKSIPYPIFLASNKKTLSLGTKIYLLGQITTTLIYLKKHNIVHANLIPKNIKLKKKLIVKIVDFTKSYHSDVKQNNDFQFYQYKKPSKYLLNRFQNRFQSEKYDCFSLCVLLFQTLFYQQTFHICNNNEYQDDAFNFNYSIQQKKLVMCIQKFKNYGHNKLMNLLGNLCLKTFEIQQKQQWSKKIPYIDWIFAILKQVITILSN